MRSAAKLLLPLMLLAAVPAFAQTAPAADQNAPPARVGRVAFTSGNVAVYQLGQTDWDKAAVNLPVASGDWFATDPQGRAELRIGPDSIDLANNSEINIADLRERVMQIAVTEGRLDLHLRDIAKSENDEIDLPIGGVWLLQPGIYDVALGANGQPTRISVFEGSARFAGGGIDKTVNSGDALVLNGSGANLTANVEKVSADEFANWCRSRDYDQKKLAAAYHVSPRMTGYEELDQYGRWEAVGQYGEVWYPSSVPVGWVPYRDGYWDWAAPWSWTWVDDEPWGFAPFHYGRWAYIDGLWGWVPGAYVDMPVYAPALVGWIGDPNAVLATALAGPAVGWFPLGPGEAYYPGYSRSQAYLRAVNASTVSNAAGLAVAPNGSVAQGQFANRRFATVVPQQAFTGGAIAARAALPVSDPAVQRAAISYRATAPQPVQTAASMAAARNPGAPNFSRLATRPGLSAAANPTAAGRRGPPGAPNFAHLAPAPQGGAAAAPARAGSTGPNEAARATAASRLGPTAGAIRSTPGTRLASPRATTRVTRATTRVTRATTRVNGPRAVVRAAGPRAVVRAAGPRAAAEAAGPRAASRGFVGRAHVAAPLAAGPHFAGPRMVAPRVAGPRMAAPHMAAAPRMAAAPHMAAAPRFAMPHGVGAPPGSGHGGGGGPPGGGGPHAGGGGGPHGGGGGGGDGKH